MCFAHVEAARKVFIFCVCVCESTIANREGG